MSDPDLRPLLAFAESLADVARPVARAHFRGSGHVERKHDRTPVTAADRAIERLLRERIAEVFPDHGVLGEEEGPHRADAEWVWVLDPIDGTKAFASGNPLFGTLIGLARRGVPVVGVLDAPALGERWAAARGLGARHQGEPIHVRPPRPLADAVLYCPTPEKVLDRPGLAVLQQRVQWTSWGGDCIAYGLLARGGADLVADAGLQPYDWCALAPIVQEAGGVVGDFAGRDLALPGDGTVLAASCPGLRDAASPLLAPGFRA